MLDPESPVAEFVSHHSGAATVFDRHHIDYCCQGHRTLTAACLDRGLQVGELLVELEQAYSEPDADADARTAPTSALINRALARQHRTLRATLTLLEHQAIALAREYASELPVLRQLAVSLEHLRTEMLEHLDHEEDELFPALLAADLSAETRAKLARMFDEHREFGGLFIRLRELTNSYTPPKGADDNVRRLFRGLAELEGLVGRHHHVENHILLPRFR